MGLSKIKFLTAIFLFPFLGTLVADESFKKMGETEQGSQVLYLVYHGKTKEALDLYLEYCKRSRTQDLELLQQVAMQILEQGSESKDPEIQLLSVFGAGISGNSALIPILEKGLQSENPSIQLSALNFLGKFQDDEADELIYSALSSPFLIIRLEAAFHLAQKKHPKVLGQIESLMYKTPAQIKPVFPQIIAAMNSPTATKLLRQFFTDTDAQVRIETILNVAETGRDDLLPQIRTLTAHPDVAELETCALALGVLKDEQSIPLLRQLACSPIDNIRLAASYSLYMLGDSEKITEILILGKKGHPFAIFVMGEIKEDHPQLREILLQLVKDSDLNVRINAAIALLKHKDSACLPSIQEILIQDSRDLVFREGSSAGRGLKAWKAIPNSTQKSKDNSLIFASSLHLRERVLKMCTQLSDDVFMELANQIFSVKQYDLIPILVDLLRYKQTPQAIALLKIQQQKAGAPLIRNYCNVALFRLNEEGPYEENLKKWILEKQNSELIRFRDVIPRSQLKQSVAHLLTPEETSRLLVESFEALASCQNEVGIEAIVKAIANGNSKNKYALAGLLLKTAE